jgi:hypothetical protein
MCLLWTKEWWVHVRSHGVMHSVRLSIYFLITVVAFVMLLRSVMALLNDSTEDGLQDAHKLSNVDVDEVSKELPYD